MASRIAGFGNTVGIPAAAAEHDLPWRLESLDILDGGDVFPEDEAHRRFKFEEIEGTEDYDAAGRGNIRYVADGKNLYRISMNDGVESEFIPEGYAKVEAECVGVCDPDTYREIMENEGFDGVLNYVDGNQRDAIGYEPGRGFIRHSDDGEFEGEFYDNSQARRAVEEVRAEGRTRQTGD